MKTGVALNIINNWERDWTDSSRLMAVEALVKNSGAVNVRKSNIMAAFRWYWNHTKEEMA